MKNFILLLALFVSPLLTFAQNWVQSTTFPGNYATKSRQAGISVTIGTKTYIGLGLAIDGGVGFLLKDFWVYDSNTNNWTQLQDFPGTGRKDAMAFAVGLNVYAGGGDITNLAFGTVTAANDFYVFNTQTGTWIQTTSLPAGRCQAASFAIGNTGYISCGKGSNNTYFTDLLAFDPITTSWTSLAPIPGGNTRTFPLGFSINGKGYVGGGWNGFWTLTNNPPQHPTFYFDFWEYNPATNQWTAKANVPVTNDGIANPWGARCISYCDKGYTIGGADTNGYYSSVGKKVYQYNTINNTWQAMPDLPFKVGRTYGGLTNGYLQFGMGATNNSDKFYSYSLHTLTTPLELCSTAPVTFTNQTSSTTVSWSSSNSSALSFSPTSGTTVTANRLNGYNNQVTATATMTGSSGCVVTRSNQVWLGTPIITNQKVDGGYYSPGMQICPGNHFLNVTPMGGNTSNAIWTVPAGVPFFAGTNSLDFTLYSTMSSVSIGVKSSNSCGQGSTTYFYLNKKTYGCGGYLLSVYPNPAQDELNIAIIPEDKDQAEKESVEIDEAILVNSFGDVVLSTKNKNKAIKLQLNGLRKGQYFLHIKVGGETVTEQVLINQ